MALLNCNDGWSTPFVSVVGLLRASTLMFAGVSTYSYAMGLIKHFTVNKVRTRYSSNDLTHSVPLFFHHKWEWVYVSQVCNVYSTSHILLVYAAQTCLLYVQTHYSLKLSLSLESAIRYTVPNLHILTILMVILGIYAGSSEQIDYKIVPIGWLLILLSHLTGMEP